MVAGDGDDGRGVVAEGVVELVVVISGFAEVVDNVAEVEEERGDVGGIGLLEVSDELVGDEVFGGRAFDAAGVADAVEDNLAGGGNGLHLRCALAAVDLLEREDGLDRVAPGLGNGFNRGDFLIALVGDRGSEAGGIGCGLRLGEDGAAGGGGLGSRRFWGLPGSGRGGLLRHGDLLEESCERDSVVVPPGRDAAVTGCVVRNGEGRLPEKSGEVPRTRLVWRNKCRRVAIHITTSFFGRERKEPVRRVPLLPA